MPGISSNRLTAFPPRPADLATVYTWVNDPSVSWRWRSRGVQITPEQFQNSTGNDVASFVGWGSGCDELVAYGAMYAMDVRALHSQIALLSNPRYVGTGLAIELGIIMVDFAFRTYPLHKVFFEFPSFNRPLFHRVLDRFGTLEAEIRDHVYYDGSTHSTFMYSLSREVWETGGAAVWRRIYQPALVG